ncbi:MAG: sulfate adenylyltransferase subunit 1 [Actinomycetota bacterium]
MLTTTGYPAVAATDLLSGAGSQASLLRFTTAGSVDDGKSTLIGRLLYDSKAIYEDQIASVRRSGINRSTGPIDLSLFTDGLRAEREQGITIDVAYRYFSTPRRKFIIADTPGHEQYTRNMATGASTADAAVILIDARKGLLRQSRRHIYISALLGIRHVIAAVNKMDLAGYSEEVFLAVSHEFQEFCRRLGVSHTHAVPVSALHGENVAKRGKHMAWYQDPPLLQLLEDLPAARPAASGRVRFPVQYVIRPDEAFRGFAGRVSSGRLVPGAPVLALPSGVKTKIRSILTFNGELHAAEAGSSVTVTLEDEIDLGRGDLLASPGSPPQTASRLQASLVWMHSDQMRPGKAYVLKHTTRAVRARVASIRHRVDVDSLSERDATALEVNDIASVIIETAQPLHFDSYEQNRTMGSFILIDPLHHATVAAGMIVAPAELEPEILRAERVRLSERVLRNGHPPAAVWLVDQPDLARALEREMFARGWHAQMLSADEFDSHQLKGAAKALRTSGAITLLSVSGESAGLQREVEAIFGPENVLQVGAGAAGPSGAVTELLQHLQRASGRLE